MPELAVNSPQSLQAADQQRLIGVRRLAFWLAGLSVVVMAVSVYLRLDFAGLGCADWPACYGQRLSEASRPLTGFARGLHRISATAALLVAILLTWRAWRPTPLQPVAMYAGWLLALMLTLSVIGIVSADPHLVLVSFINMLGGIGLVSFSFRVLISSGTAPDAADLQAGRLLWRVALACVTLTILLGVLIGARYAGATCTTLPHCGGTWWPTPETWALLNPIDKLAVAPAPGDSGGSGLHLLHRYAAMLAVIMLGAVCVKDMQNTGTRGSARLILVVLGVTVLLGAIAVLSTLNLWATLAHALAATALVVVLARQQVIDNTRRR